MGNVLSVPNPTSTRPEPTSFYRWMVLFFVSVTMLGNYYVYDCIAPIADLLTRQLGFSDSNIGLLQAIYSMPNVVMVLVGGYVVDRIGTRKAILIFGALCFVGSIVTCLSGVLAVMATGRLIFGLGAESLIVAVTTAVAKWFRGKELSFAFGINLMISRAGSLLAQQSPSWAGFAYGNWRNPLWISVGFASLCIIGAIIYWVLEVHAEHTYQIGHAGATDKVVFSDVKTFGLSYWYIVALCVTFYSGIFPFETFAYKFFMDAHHVTREASGDLVGMLTLFTMFGTPIFGLFVDKLGKRGLLMMLGSLLLIPVYLLSAYVRSAQYVTVYLPSSADGHFAFVAHHLPPILLLTMAMMGIAFSLVPAVMWPSVAYLVDQAKLGTAYGLMTMIQNIGLAGFNLLIGWANDHSHAGPSNPAGYDLGMWIFSSVGFLGLTFAFLLRQRELGPHGHGLETITTTKK
jgi:MFS family permease